MSMFLVLLGVAIALMYCAAALKLLRSRTRRPGVTSFLVAGTVLAALRIGIVWYLYYRLQGHTHMDPVPLLTDILLPENAFIYLYLPPIESREWYAIVLTILLAVCSFIWVFPLLLIGATRKHAEKT